MNKILIMVAMIFAMGNVAVAGDWYVGIDANQTDQEIGGFNLDEVNGFGITGGYNWNNWLATEVNYSDLGSGTTGGINHDTTSTAVFMVADPVIANIGGMDLKAIAKLGVADTKLNTQFGSVSDTAAAYGLGAGLTVAQDLDVVLMYTKREIDFGGATLDLDTVSLGLKYEF